VWCLALNKHNLREREAQSQNEEPGNDTLESLKKRVWPSGHVQHRVKALKGRNGKKVGTDF